MIMAVHVVAGGETRAPHRQQREGRDRGRRGCHYSRAARGGGERAVVRCSEACATRSRVRWLSRWSVRRRNRPRRSPRPRWTEGRPRDDARPRPTAVRLHARHRARSRRRLRSSRSCSRDTAAPYRWFRGAMVVSLHVEVDGFGCHHVGNRTGRAASIRGFVPTASAVAEITALG